MTDLPDEITLKLRFTGDPCERAGHDGASRVSRLRAAVKVLFRRFGLRQYKRGPVDPPEVIVVECPNCKDGE